MKSPVWCDRRIIVNPFHMGVCLTEEAFWRAMNYMKIPVGDRPPFISTPQANATLHTFSHTSGKQVALLCMRDWEGRNPIEVAGLIVHEAVHLWQQVREYIGEKNPSSEFEAYSVQAIAQDLMQGFVDAQKC